MAVMQSYFDTSKASWDAISIFDDNSQEASENVTLTNTLNELDSSDMNEDSVLEGSLLLTSTPKQEPIRKM